MDYKFWVLSDTHFGHDKIIEYCNRPKNHEQIILDNIVKTVNKQDVLIHLGDITFGLNKIEWLQRLSGIPCRKWLVKGNHDNNGLNTYLDYFDFVGDSLSLIYQKTNILFSHKPTNLSNSKFDINIHGHLHNSNHHSYDYYSENHINVSVEVIDFQPVLLSLLVLKWKNSPKILLENS